MKKVYEVLQEIDTNFPSSAICRQVIRKAWGSPPFLDWALNKDKAFKSWPKFSGDLRFPVPFKVFGVFPISPETAYHTREKWTGRYGRDRRELLEHLIQWFKERDL